MTCAGVFIPSVHAAVSIADCINSDITAGDCADDIDNRVEGLTIMIGCTNWLCKAL